MSTEVAVAVIVAVGALLSTGLTTWLSARQTRVSKEQDWARQDLLATNAAQAAKESADKAARATKALQESQDGAAREGAIAAEAASSKIDDALQAIAVLSRKVDDLAEQLAAGQTATLTAELQVPNPLQPNED